jgi:hypothetical protein
MRLELKGLVATGDPCRVSECGELDGHIHIDDTDLVDAIAEEKWDLDGTKVYLDGKEIANGRLVADTGWGYSEYTPMDPDSLRVGECDLLELLDALEGEHVSLLITDEGDLP